MIRPLPARCIIHCRRGGAAQVLRQAGGAVDSIPCRPAYQSSGFFIGLWSNLGPRAVVGVNGHEPGFLQSLIMDTLISVSIMRPYQ